MRAKTLTRFRVFLLGVVLAVSVGAVGLFQHFYYAGKEMQQWIFCSDSQ